MKKKKKNYPLVPRCKQILCDCSEMKTFYKSVQK